MHRIKLWLVVRLVRWASKWIDKSYRAWAWRDSKSLPLGQLAEIPPDVMESLYRGRFWTPLHKWYGNMVSEYAIKLAERIDRDNEVVGQAMANEGWWG